MCRFSLKIVAQGNLFSMEEVDNASAGIEARKDAENFFKQGNLDKALETIMKAAELEPKQPDNLKFFAAYITHKGAAMNRSFYTLLRIKDPFTDVDAIEEEYRKIERLLNPGKNESIAAANALKIVNAAYEVLSDPDKRLAYNSRMGFVPKDNAEYSSASEKKSLAPAADVPPPATVKHQTMPYNIKTEIDQSPSPRTESASVSPTTPYNIKTEIDESPSLRKESASASPATVKHQTTPYNIKTEIDESPSLRTESASASPATMKHQTTPYNIKTEIDESPSLRSESASVSPVTVKHQTTPYNIKSETDQSPSTRSASASPATVGRRKTPYNRKRKRYQSPTRTESSSSSTHSPEKSFQPSPKRCEGCNRLL
ncbi:uncharacterized protein LOC110814941 [Carica papaya]|uniref:uncharacterized protein LOC110814941 n=1 Tax=Carica papaya TaxID=3649 RepID=UPI000B8CD8DD|nr:uncharacterized protein LOC110814941 [Carica papaya]